jgi:hypothetical protein
MDPIRFAQKQVVINARRMREDARKMRERARQNQPLAEAAVARAKAIVQALRAQQAYDPHRERVRGDDISSSVETPNR